MVLPWATEVGPEMAPAPETETWASSAASSPMETAAASLPDSLETASVSSVTVAPAATSAAETV